MLKGAVKAICLEQDVSRRPKSFILERAGLREAAEELQPGFRVLGNQLKLSLPI